MPIELAQIDLLHLSAARAINVEKIIPGGDGDANHRRPARLMARWAVLQQLVPTRNGFQRQRTVHGLGILLGLADFAIDVVV